MKSSTITQPYFQYPEFKQWNFLDSIEGSNMHQDINLESIKDQKKRIKKEKELKKIEEEKQKAADKAKLIVKLDEEMSELALSIVDKTYKTGERSKIAYRMAEISHMLSNLVKFSSYNPCTINGLDVSDFIFGNTHYDECSHGYYFRRS